MWTFGQYGTNKIHKTLASQFAQAVYWKFLGHLHQEFTKDSQEEPITINVEGIAAADRAKVRHLGGWATRKFSTLCPVQPLYRKETKTLKAVTKHQRMCKLLEESLIIPFCKLEESTQYPETLGMTENRQYRKRSLIHITDHAYLFFMCLEGL